MIISKKMNFFALVLFSLVTVTLVQENITATVTDQPALLCDNTAKASKILENIVTEARDCLLGYFTLDDIKTRVEIGRNNDILDIVSEEFCLVKRIIQRCVNQSLPVADGCFTDDEQDSSRLLQDITRSLLTFVCQKHGEGIRGGIECIENNTNGLENCFEEAIGDSNFSGLTGENLYQNIIANATMCEPYNKLRGCVFNVLQACTGAIPANTVDSLFDHIKTFTTCDPAKH